MKNDQKSDTLIKTKKKMTRTIQLELIKKKFSGFYRPN